MSDLDLLFLQRHVDQLLAPWDRSDTPGVTIGIIRGRSLILHRSAGMASLELGVPIGPATNFRIASVSKQFTCAAALMLVADSRLSLDAELRTFFPALPDYGYRITVAHLMHNSSGIRDMLEIMRFGGVDLGCPCQPEHLLEGICRQRALNFVPDTRYLYSNSNFMLLGRIVEQVSRQPLAEYLAERIFVPLGMTRTRHVTNTQEPVAGLATGYLPAGDGFIRAAHQFPLHGEGGLVSSVQDLALWHVNFAAPRLGYPGLAAALTTQQRFIHGGPNDYARGVGIRHWRGIRLVEHGGLWPGFKTAFIRAPEQDAAVICISNHGGTDPHALAMSVLATLLEGTPALRPAPSMPSRDVLATIGGRWLDRSSGVGFDVAVQDEAVTITSNGVGFTAMPTEDGRLTAPTSTTKFTLRPLPNPDAVEVEHATGLNILYGRVSSHATPPAGIEGRYSNDDMAAVWDIAGDQVTVTGPLLRGVQWQLEVIEGDCCRIIAPSNLYRSWFDVRVQRGPAGQVTGLLVNGGRAKGLLFARVG